MTTYRVYSGASGANDGTSWTDAYTSFASAVSSATMDVDVILVHYTHQEAVSANTIYTIGADIMILSVDKDNSDTLTKMAFGGWLGDDTTDYSIEMNGARNVYSYGLTFRVGAGAGNDNITFNGTDGGHFVAEEPTFWLSHTGTGGNSFISIGAGGANAKYYTQLINPIFRYGGDQPTNFFGNLDIIAGSISSLGSAPSTWIGDGGAARGATVSVSGMDLSHLGSGVLVGDITSSSKSFVFSNCKLGSGFVMYDTTPTLTNKSGALVFLFDCDSGDVHTSIGYADAFGTVVSENTIKFTGGAAGMSWKIVTTGNCSYRTPFTTPWIDMYNDTLSSISPYMEILRDGNATAYQDDEVWGEFAYKNTSGSVQLTTVNDRLTPADTLSPSNQTAGADTWDGENATHWSGKVESGSITPAENGHIRARLVVGEPSTTVYLDPQIRT